MFFVFKDEDDFGFNVEQHSNFADPSAVLEPSLDNIESCERKPDVKTGPNSKNDNKFVCYTTLDGMYKKKLQFIAK